MHKNETEKLHHSIVDAANCFNESGYIIGEIYALSRLANYYSKHDNFKLAEKYYKQLLDMTNTLDDDNIKEMIYLNMANFYNEQVKTEQAIYYYKLLESSIEESKNTKRLKPLYNNLGVIYYFQHNYDKAAVYLNKSLAVKKEEGDSLGMFATYQNLFRISLKTNRLDDAEYYRSQLSSLQKQIHVPSEQALAFSFNSTDYYILSGDKKEALASFHHYASDKDSISNSVFSDKLLAIEKNQEVAKRDQDILFLEQQGELHNAQMKNLHLVIGFSIVLIIVLLMSGLYFKSQWQKLIKADELLQAKQDEILTINKRLETSNQSKDRILSVIGHDLRGPVGGLKELVELYMELPELEPNDIANLLNAARSSSTSAYHLLENLLTWANSQRGEILFKPQITPIYPVIKKSIQLLDQSINNKGIEFKLNVEPSLSLHIDIQMFRTIIRNIVSNSIKYSPDKGIIEVDASVIDDKIQFCISDEGQGIAADEIKHIFDKKETYYIGSGKSAKGTGLGLILCKEFVEKHGGTIWLDSKEGIGTCVCFTIPDKNRRYKQETIAATSQV